jgi:CHAT domain-containing protein
MQILHLELRLNENGDGELIYFSNQPNARRTTAIRPLGEEISALINRSETGYYVSRRIIEDPIKLGQVFYEWLDGDERLLKNKLRKHQDRPLVLAITTSGRLEHLPWETLHDGNDFLINQRIIPIRRVRDDNAVLQRLEIAENPVNRPLKILFMASSPQDTDTEENLEFEREEAEILQKTKKLSLNLIVEESGWLEELSQWIKSQKNDPFDIIHLSSHGTKSNGKVCLITDLLIDTVNHNEEPEKTLSVAAAIYKNL